MSPFERGAMVHEVGSTPSPEYPQVYRTVIIFATQPLSPLLDYDLAEKY
jgi:hypothetical protein